MEQLQERAPAVRAAREDEPSWFGPACAVASVLLHLGGAYALTRAHTFFPPAAEPTLVEFAFMEVVPPPPPPKKVEVPKPKPPAPPPGPRFVAVSDLSRAPRPPNLDDALERNYPKAARTQGIGGNAVLRAQVLPDGRIGSVKRTSETFAGFAEACERTLRSAAWSPPIDRAGLPVGTEITYTCRFDVRE